MSAPPATTVHAPVFGSYDWLPAGVGLPMSAQLHGEGHDWGGVPVVEVVVVDVDVVVDVEVVLVVVLVLVVVVVVVLDAPTSVTLSNSTVLVVPVLCEVTARPSSTDAPSESVNVEFGIRVHVTPSVDVNAENVFPERDTFRYTGVVPAGFASLTVVPPWTLRSCTLIPAPGDTNTP
jgi:hypothetical protein